MDAFIAELLAAATEEHSENTLSVDEIRESLIEHQEMQTEEIQRFPEEKGNDHWDVVIADYNSDRKGLFFLAFFSGDSVTFITGRGNIQKLKDFTLTDLPENPSEILDEFISRFRIFGGPTKLDLETIESWLDT